MAIITISRLSGSLGDELSSYIADKLGYPLINREFVMDNFFGDLSSGLRNRLDESAKFFLNSPDNSETTYKDIISRKLIEIADENDGNIVVLGLGACVVFDGDKRALNIRVMASEDVRCKRTAKHFNLSTSQALESIKISDRKHKKFVSTLWDKDLNDTSLFDMTLDTSRLSVEECASAIIAMAHKKDERLLISNETALDESIDHQSTTPVFKNDTEAEFARILDMYNIEWMYEPKTFPIEYDAEGNICSAFSPDFYLPKFNLYLELTTMDQKYVTKKNKKVRMMHELYPDVNVRIVYKKDFLELVERLKQFG